MRDMLQSIVYADVQHPRGINFGMRNGLRYDVLNSIRFVGRQVGSRPAADATAL